MATDDDDILTGPVPLPDAEPTSSERSHAKTFADLVDKTLAGRTPPAMSADDRALLEVATVIRAASGNAELAAAKRRSLVAAAAVLVLWMRGTPAPATHEIATTPMSQRSRSADALIGPIPRERAGDASTRIDAIYADRLDGYRELQLARGRKP
jgi:hypothetical protein